MYCPALLSIVIHSLGDRDVLEKGGSEGGSLLKHVFVHPFVFPQDFCVFNSLFLLFYV